MLSFFFSRSEECRSRCHRSLEQLSCVFGGFRFFFVVRGTWLIELVEKLGLRPPLFCLRRRSRGTLWYGLCYRITVVVDVGAAVASVGTHGASRFVASVVAVDSSQSYDGSPRGRWPSEDMPCKLDGIVHFKSNSSPEAVYLPGFLPIPGTLASSVSQCDKHPGYGYIIFIPARNFCMFCTPFTIPETSGSSVRLSYPYPELLDVLYYFHTLTLNFYEFCATRLTIPGVRVQHDLYPPGTSVSSVRPCRNTRHFCEFCNTSIP